MSPWRTPDLIFLRAIDLPVFGQENSSLTNFADQFLLFLAVFASDIHVTVVCAIHFEIKMARIGSFMRLEANELDFVLPVVESGDSDSRNKKHIE
jgi:hypothetical protein